MSERTLAVTLKKVAMTLVGGLAVLAVILNLHHLWETHARPGLPPPAK